VRGVDSVVAEFRRFASWLNTTRPEELRRIASLANGFEGWIKLEFFFWLTSYRKPRLSADVGAPGGADVGLEYKVSLNPSFNGTPKVKQCDIWVRSKIQPSLFHYIELKAPFLNKNTGKLLDSSARDFLCMSQIRHSYEQALSGSAIILGVGFDDVNWQKGLSRVRAYPGVPEELVLADEGPLDNDGRIRWCVLTKTYG